jgi:hypothetical protein
MVGVGKKVKALAVGAVALGMLAACEPAANVAARNISAAADNFEIQRRVVFYNGITGQYILVIEGLCSLGNNDTRLRMSVTCKTGPTSYKRHFLGLSDNVTFFAEQLDSATASQYRYRVMFNPLAAVPSIEIR